MRGGEGGGGRRQRSLPAPKAVLEGWQEAKAQGWRWVWGWRRWRWLSGLGLAGGAGGGAGNYIGEREIECEAQDVDPTVEKSEYDLVSMVW